MWSGNWEYTNSFQAFHAYVYVDSDIEFDCWHRCKCWCWYFVDVGNDIDDIDNHFDVNVDVVDKPNTKVCCAFVNMFKKENHQHLSDLTLKWLMLHQSIISNKTRLHHSTCFRSILTSRTPPWRTFCRQRTGIHWKWNDLVLQSAAALRDSVMMVLLYISGPWPVHQPIRKQNGLYRPIREQETHAPPIHQWSVAALSELTSWIHNRGHQAAATFPAVNDEKRPNVCTSTVTDTIIFITRQMQQQQK